VPVVDGWLHCGVCTQAEHLKPEKRKYYEMYLDRMDSEEGEVLGDICSRVEVVLLNARYNGTSTLVRG